MAVYQISKIQIRRGKAKTGPGFPQLASGEMGWAIDSQELYIGSGAISEGAPDVANVKVLTAKDFSAANTNGSNITSLIEHIYKNNDGIVITGENSNNPVIRHIQTVLDDSVNTSSFGAIGNGTVDDTSALQRAIDQLFANTHTKSFVNTSVGINQRVTLRIPAGIYKITSTLHIPSYATIVGAGINKTIIHYTGTGTAINLISDTDTSVIPYVVVTPRYIHIEGITVKSIPANSANLATIGLDITNASNSKFSNIELVGNWTTGAALTNKGISISNTTHTSFNNIVISNFYYGVYIDDVVTDIVYESSTISYTTYGIVVGIDLDNTHAGATNLHISNCKFNNIELQALKSNVGLSNSITSCYLTNVGGINATPTVPQLYFIKPNFSCSDIRSDRSTVLSSASSAVTYVPEISGSGSYDSKTLTVTTIEVTAVSLGLLRLPVRTDQTGVISGSISYNISYSFSGAVDRSGTLSIIVSGASVSYSDDYIFDSTVGDGSLLTFTVAIVNDSIKVSYTNTLDDNVGTLTYSYTSKF